MKVVILDTECGNLSSIKWAIKRLGYTPHISFNPDIVMQADKLFLPGVGAARTVMKHLKKHNLIDLIKNYTKPVLGICLGMQLLGRSSDENGGVSTLGIINEPVTLMNTSGLPLPHMGWNQLTIKSGHCLFQNISNDSYFYFVHSYAMCINISTIAQCNYSLPFSAAIEYDNFFGVQFHPERSGKAGAQLLKNFLEI
ncbi:imidazole glycerol phosphate synthase subunit HisH [Candidatus Pantoea carbekii]|uniref:imidazole glycerol phosphate synthase subunit HisH n=1 Tax=Candidatus Pantoea carbekii TaxID=1235990 RepID=UPI0006187993|nr:imidazole glycerol phosphate synthase subunit HisH [Candidatus Pantoea carbekii]AKC32021.1 Imidazole glycerol phosphate synthase subunit HisH HisH [Candidatus Pantoea carbekii]